jgi:glycosyltransferase involved in cell wall biosynthesis
MRGGEYVLEAVAELFPDAELFTLIAFPDKVSPRLAALPRHTSALQKIPGIGRKYRKFLPLFPSLIESFDLEGFDLIISTSHCVAKGIRKPPGSVHVSYIFAPMRYIWDRYEDYFGPGRSSLSVRLAAKIFRKRLQKWDRKTGSMERIDHVIALSRYIAGQIEEHYGRPAEVIYPFANLERFSAPRQPGKSYLIVSAFAPYKRIDLAIDAFNELGLPLLIVGEGQDEKNLRAKAGPQIEFLGALSNAAIADLYAKCRAFVFPGHEDFGITPVEAMAAGAPVIAYGAGGVAETVTEKTGLFFPEQTVPSLVAAVRRFESGSVKFSEEDCRQRAAVFTKDRFKRELLSSVRATWEAGKRKGAPHLLGD